MTPKKTAYVDTEKEEALSTFRSNPTGNIPHGTVMEDSSGNGNHGQYFSTAPGVNFASSQEGLVSGDTAVNVESGAYGFIQDPILDWDTSFTIEQWIKLGSFVGGGAWPFLLTSGDPPDGTNDLVILNARGFDADVPNIRFLLRPAEVDYRSDPIPTSQFDGFPHHLVVAIDYSIIEFGWPEVFFYWDGVAIPRADRTGRSPGGAPAFIYFGQLAFFGTFMDEVALYPHVLSPERVAAHYAAASTSFAAYTAAVLADTPSAYYHLNEAGVSPRNVATTTQGEIKIMKRKSALIDTGSQSAVSVARPAPVIPFLP